MIVGVAAGAALASVLALLIKQLSHRSHLHPPSDTSPGTIFDSNLSNFHRRNFVMSSDCDASASGSLRPHNGNRLCCSAASRQGAWAGDLPAVSCAIATQGFATELTGAFEAIPVVTGGELIISRLVFTRLVLISAHTKKIDANRHMMAKKPV